MFKVFNRGHKVQLNESDPVSQSKLPPSHYRRQTSLRHSHYFGHTDAYSTLTSNKSSAPKLINSQLNNTKKYVSCENVRNAVEEYQDVIDEDSGDDENGLKEKLVKRYNSLTTLLMKSFRKAKIKKKKEAMLNESKLETNYENSVSTYQPPIENNNEQIEKSSPSLRSNNSIRKDSAKSNEFSNLSKKNKSIRLTERNELNSPIVKRPVINSTIKSNKSFREYLNDDEIDEDNYESKKENEIPKIDQNKDDESNEEENNESVPVFLGVKMISSEFVDLKPLPKPTISSPVSSSLNTSSASKASTSNSLCKIEPKVSYINSSVNNEIASNFSTMKSIKESTRNEKLNSSTISKYYSLNRSTKLTNNETYDEIKLNSSLTSSKLTPNNNNNNNKTDSSISISIVDKKQNLKSPRLSFNSNSKQQAPKPPVSQIPQTQTQQESNEDSKSNFENRVIQKQATLRRSKTFTQQLQDILLERKQNSIQPKLSDELTQEILEKKFEKIEEKILPPPRFNINTKQETLNIEQTNKAVEINEKNENTKQNNNDLANASFLTNDDLFEKNYVKKLKNINNSILNFYDSKDNLAVDDLCDMNDFSTFNTNSFDKEDENTSDDFKDLVNVLSRQDNDFKKKFFECLMTKLWDTTLPYSEYLQLNKLMTALFGESYHKIDSNFLAQQKISPNTSASSSNKSTKISKLEAEHVVNLMKIYLESNSSNTNNYTITNQIYPKDEFEFEYPSVSNLINTLKRRQKYDTLAKRVEEFNNIKLDQLLKPEALISTLEENGLDKINFLTGFDFNQKDLSNQASLKNSFVLKVDRNDEKKLLEKYLELNYSKENLSQSQIIEINSATQERSSSSFKRNKLRQTVGNIDSKASYYTTSTLNRRPPPPPIINTSSSSKITEKRSDTDVLKPKQALTSINIANQNANNFNLENKRKIYEAHNNFVKSAGIITSFQPVSQFIAQSSLNQNATKNNLTKISNSTKRNSSVGPLNSEVRKNAIENDKIYREEVQLNLSNALNNSSIKKVLNLNQHKQLAQIQPLNHQEKLTKIRSVKELFRNNEECNGANSNGNNNLIYVKQENLQNINELAAIKQENLLLNHLQKKKQILSSLNHNNKFLLSQSTDCKNLIKNQLNTSIVKNVLNQQPNDYSTLGTKKSVNNIKNTNGTSSNKETIYYQAKKYEKSNIKHFLNSNPGKETEKIYQEKSKNINNLSDLISNKFYKYDGREMKQAFY